MRFLITIFICLMPFLCMANDPLIYKGAEAFSPQIRDRLAMDYNEKKFLPTDNANCSVIQLTDGSFWKSEMGDFSKQDWPIGTPVILEIDANDVAGPAEMINLVSFHRERVYEVSKSQAKAEKKKNDRFYSLPIYDKPCLFKLHQRLDRLQIGARKILWEFEPVVYTFLPTVDWTRGVTLSIRGSGHPDYPYWILYGYRDGTWIPAILVKPNPKQLKLLEE